MFTKVCVLCIGLLGLLQVGCSPLPTGSPQTFAKSNLRRADIDAGQTRSSGVRKDRTSLNVADEGPAKTTVSSTCNSKSGYCESCQTYHGQTQSAPFKFSQPLPEFQTSTSPEPPIPPEDLGYLLKQIDASQPAIVRVEPTAVGESGPPPSRLTGNESSVPNDVPRPAIEATMVAFESSSPPKAVAGSVPEPPGNSLATMEAPANLTLTEEKTEPNAIASAKPPAPPQPDEDLPEERSEANATKPADTVGNSKSDSSDPAAESEPAASKPNFDSVIQQLRCYGSKKIAPEDAEEFENEIQVLELIAKRVGDSIESGQVTQQTEDLFHHQLAALASTLQPDTLDPASPAGRRNASESLRHLHEATAELERLVSLKIHNGALCSVVRGYGQYDCLRENILKPGQSVLLYCEVENFQSKLLIDDPSEASYCTQLKSSLVICDEHGAVVQQADFPAVQDQARNRRRDFYLHVPFTVGQLPPGTYRVHLLVDDLLGCKQSALEPAVEFCIK